MRVGNGNGNGVTLLFGSIWRCAGGGSGGEMGDLLTCISAGDGGDGVRTIGEADATALDRRKTGKAR